MLTFGALVYSHYEGDQPAIPQLTIPIILPLLTSIWRLVRPLCAKTLPQERVIGRVEIHVGIRRTLNPYLWEWVGREMCSVVKEPAEAFRSFIFVDVESALVTFLYDDRSRWGS